MRILMVTPFYHPIIGGTESLIAEMASKLNEIGESVDIMTFNINQSWKPWSINQSRKGRIEKIDGLKVIKVSALTLPLTRIIFRTNFIPGRFLDKLKEYDIIHFHNDVDLSFPIFSRSVNKPKIFHCHCLSITYDSYRKNPIQRYFLKKSADIYIAPSFFVSKLIADLGISKKRIRIVYNGINITKFRPSENAKIENMLLFVGRLDPKKGLLILLKALNYLNTRVQLIIIGPPSRPWFFKKLLLSIKRINGKGVHRVIYLGMLKLDEIIEWYQKASVFVCPSLSESFGIANVEALSCATPVVATNVGGISEVVKNYENGILVPPNDAVRLANGIQYLLDNEDVRKKFGQNGRRYIIEKFSSEAAAKRLIQVYKELI